MRSALLYAFVVLFAGIATALLIVNLHAPTTGVLAFVGALYVLALVLAGFADSVTKAVASVAPYLPFGKKDSAP